MPPRAQPARRVGTPLAPRLSRAACRRESALRKARLAALAGEVAAGERCALRHRQRGQMKGAAVEAEEPQKLIIIIQIQKDMENINL